ncbi:MAG: tRNA (guanine-N7-)-methyltransferase [Planctomycetota bacterium]|jgi:tRNA (guanine-N7-)-methyltransferase
MARRLNKRDKWAENHDLARVHEPDRDAIVSGGATYLKGEWGTKAFEKDQPITLELGCGQGLFAVDLARRFPDRNFIGIDVKSHRFHKGAKEADTAGVANIAFLRTRIQWLDRFFGPDEISEIWLTFSDPQEGDKRGTKRLTSAYYLRLYQSMLKEGGRVRVKTDSQDLYERTLEHAEEANMRVTGKSANVHAERQELFDDELAESLGFITAFEQRWIEDGRRIHYAELEKTQPLASEDLVETLRMLQGPAERTKPRFPRGKGITERVTWSPKGLD